MRSAPKSRPINSSVSPQGGDGPRAFGIDRAKRVGGEEPPHQYAAAGRRRAE
jgi:hypothetical protein